MPHFRINGRAGVVCLLCMLVLLGMAALAAQAIWPRKGESVATKSGFTVDDSHADEGYILARMEKPTSQKLKLRISKGDMTYTYDLSGEGEYEVFPLQMGSGKYKCSLYENVKGNKYSKKADISVNADMADENAPFLCPSQYVNYTQDSPAVQKAAEVCQGLTTDEQKLKAIREFMTRGFTYDYVRALTTPASYLGDIDGCYQTRMGLCQDLAAVAACMLRSQGVPTQMAIGYAGKIYHAWNYVLIDGEYQLLDITGELSFMSKDTVYTAERIY